MSKELRTASAAYVVICKFYCFKTSVAYRVGKNSTVLHVRILASIELKILIFVQSFVFLVVVILRF